MGSLRAFLFAFGGALGWFIWAVESETTGSCFSGSHYVGSAAIALGIVVALQVALEAAIRSSGDGSVVRRRSIIQLAGVAVASIVLMAIGLLIGGFFAAAISCSA